jgi:hypothetical protein
VNLFIEDETPDPLEVDPPTSRRYIESWCICTHSAGWHSKYGCEAKDCACNWGGDE